MEGGFLKTIRTSLGILSMEERIAQIPPDKRAKFAERRLSGEKNAEARATIKESRRILELQGYTEAQKLRLPETQDLKYKDGTAWLNLVLALYSKNKGILIEVLDLPNEIRKILAQEKERRGTMPEAKQMLLDQAELNIKSFLNTPANDNKPQTLEKAA